MPIRFLLEGKKPQFLLTFAISGKKTKVRISCGSRVLPCLPHLVWVDKGRPAKSPGLGENPPCGRKTGKLATLFLLVLLALLVLLVLWCARGVGGGVCPIADGLGLEAVWDVKTGFPNVLKARLAHGITHQIQTKQIQANLQIQGMSFGFFHIKKKPIWQAKIRRNLFPRTFQEK